ncbi:MAG TPA: hypothetical protein VK957_19005, partial [Lunatimonas sp.]|nr:hypothetical protein [Lunatimonas sp.]
NTGAISSWRLELPTEVRQFDYNTISDVIVHVKYTAREGGSGLKAAANAALKDQLVAIKQDLNQNGLHIAIIMKHDLPNEWLLLKKNGSIDLVFDKSRLPYMVQQFEPKIDSVRFLGKAGECPTSLTIKKEDGGPTILTWVGDLKFYEGNNPEIDFSTSFNLAVSDENKSKLDGLIIIIKWVFS